MNRSVTIPLEEYDDLKSELRAARAFKANIQRGADEVQQFISWIAKSHDLSRDIEAYNEESKSSKIIKPQGSTIYRVVITGLENE